MRQCLGEEDTTFKDEASYRVHPSHLIAASLNMIRLNNFTVLLDCSHVIKPTSDIKDRQFSRFFEHLSALSNPKS